MSIRTAFNMREMVILLGLMAYLVMATIGLMTTTGASRVVVELSRAAAIALVLLISAGLVASIRMNVVHLMSVLIYLLLLVFGFVTAEVNAVEQDHVRYLTDVVVILAGLFIFAYLGYAGEGLDHRVARSFLLYCLLMLGITIVVGGLVFGAPPRFVFDYVSERMAKDVSYSQGVSKFFGYGALAAAYLLVQSPGRLRRWLLGLVIILFLGLSLLGGARGDSFFAVLAVLLYFALVFGLRVIWPLALIAGVLMLALSNAGFMNDLVLVQRMQGADSGYGYRDVLLLQVGQLLVERVDCLLIGCGFGFFQHYFNYPMGLYPHNIVAELVVIVGLPLAMLLLYLCFRGVWEDVRSNGIRFISLVFLYTFLLGLKSGAVSSSWLLMVLIVGFAARYVAYHMGYEEAFEP